MELFATRSNNKLSQFVSSVQEPKAWAVGCSDGVLGGPGSVCLPSSVSPGKSDQQDFRSLLQESHSGSPGLVQHAVVFGSGSSVIPNTHLPPQPIQSGEPTLQQSPTLGYGESHPPCLVPRTVSIKEQGFFEEVAPRIEASQRGGSTRSKA